MITHLDIFDIGIRNANRNDSTSVIVGKVKTLASSASIDTQKESSRNASRATSTRSRARVNSVVVLFE